MKLSKRYMVNSESGLPHAFQTGLPHAFQGEGARGLRSMCGLVDLSRTRTIFTIISRAHAEELGICLKCAKELERERIRERMASLVRRLEEEAKP